MTSQEAGTMAPDEPLTYPNNWRLVLVEVSVRHFIYKTHDRPIPLFSFLKFVKPENVKDARK